MNLPDSAEITADVAAALKEDVGPGDLTANLVPESQHIRVRVITREPAVIAGAAWVNEVFAQLDPNIEVDWQVQDGQDVQANQTLFYAHGQARSILTGERTALNFLQTLSGVATRTRQYVAAVDGTPARILDTRKTIPGLRLAQKYAVRCGGGYNHRIGLFDAYLIKENHIHACGGIQAAVQTARAKQSDCLLEIEAENMEQVATAVAAGADRVMLDNFSLDDMAEAVQKFGDDIELEASGGLELDTIRKVALTGVHYISVGALTKHVRAVDLSMRFAEQE